MVVLHEMNHKLHPGHVLKLERTATPYECDGCKELGFHSCYTCKGSSCNFHLHEHCARPRDSLTHRFFRGCTFRFLEYVGSSDRVCDACGIDVKGFVYHCDGCDKDLHPCCANLESVIEDGDQLNLVLKKKMSSKCYCCGEKKLGKISTWAYISKCNEYTFHISCVKELIGKNMMRREYLDDGEGTSEGSDSDGESDGRDLVKRTPMLQLIVGRKKGSVPAGKFAKIKTTVKIAISFIIAAILGDPTAMVAGLIANLIAH